MTRKAFTLLELLLANVLIAILLGALLLVISSIAREQKKMTLSQTDDPMDSILNLLRSDLANSESARPLANQRGFILTGHAGLYSKSLTPTDRRTGVTYEIRRRAGCLCLIREQTYLDDPIKPGRFESLIATDITSLSLTGGGAMSAEDEELNLEDSTGYLIPDSVVVHLATEKNVINQELFLR